MAKFNSAVAQLATLHVPQFNSVMAQTVTVQVVYFNRVVAHVVTLHAVKLKCGGPAVRPSCGSV